MGGNRVAGKTVVLTGASSGIGRAAALQLAESGGRVLALARRAEELQSLCEEARAAGNDIQPYPVDLSDLQALDQVAEQILQEHGTVDVLVNNAGRSIRRSFLKSLDRFHDYERCMQINYYAPVRLTMKLVPGMLEQGDGHIINVLTWGTLMNSPRFSAYIGSKSALEGFSNAIGCELESKGIAVSNIHYPLVYTPMMAPAAQHYRYMRGMSAEQAGGWIVKAIETRAPRLAPGYAVLGGLQTFAFPRAARWVTARLRF